MCATDAASVAVEARAHVLVDQLAAGHGHPHRGAHQLRHRHPTLASTSGSWATGSSVTASAPSSAARPAASRSSLDACSVSSGWPASTAVPSGDLADHPGGGVDRVLLAGPPGAEPPGRGPDRQGVQPGQVPGPGAHGRPSVFAATGSDADGSPPWARDHPLPDREGAAVGQRGGRVRVRRRHRGRASPGRPPGRPRAGPPARRHAAPRPPRPPRGRCRRPGPAGPASRSAGSGCASPAASPRATIVSASSRAGAELLHERARRRPSRRAAPRPRRRRSSCS